MGTTTDVRRRRVVTANPNGNGALTLRGSRGRTYQVVSADDAVLGPLERLSRGDAVTVVLEPVRCRGDGWRIVGIEG
ncbi:hypothetical protein ACFPM1_10410 [Halorubrum rubrum]|uniref:DUF7999 domain-containing protein n=1 Tax=Halorubrum rubrum TaxID=1126240 RepID=A0ABD5R2E7_9EURY|nr:hypothetical protein [Halorubrum rubrum]